jgi:PhnB protein
VKSVNPYLNFAGNTEEAFNFYKSVFGGDFVTFVRFRDLGDGSGMPEEALDKIMHISLPLGGGSILMATDALESMGQPLTVGNNFSISLEADSQAESERLFGRLSEGGRADMPLGKTEWAERFGACADRFGVQWMINYTGNVQFAGGQ